MKVFKIMNPNYGWDDTIEIIVCANSIEDVKSHLKPTVYGKRVYTVVDFEGDELDCWLSTSPEELIIEEVILDKPKIICESFNNG